MRRAIVMILALVMALSLFAGCGATESKPAAPASEPAAPGSEPAAPANEPAASGSEPAAPEIAWEDSYIRTVVEVDPGNYGPFQTNNTGRRQVLAEIYEALGSNQAHTAVVAPVIAKDWYLVDGEEKTYIIELYENVTDSAGNAITASDVIFSFDEGYSVFKRHLKYIKSIEALDDYTLKLELTKNEVAALDHILGQCWIVDQGAYEADPDGMSKNPIGTGPYVLKEAVEGSKVVLEARDDYWQTDESLIFYNQQRNVKKLEFIVTPESTQRAILLETGDIDIVNGMTYEQASMFMDKPDFNVFNSLDNKARVLIFNCNEASVCSNLALRQAILYAIDAQGVLDAYDGAGELAYTVGNSMYVDAYESWNDGSYYEYDLDKAKELLAEAGYKEGTAIRLLCDTSEINGIIANVLQGYLGAAGIKLEIMQYEETLCKTYMRDFTFFDIYLQYSGSSDYCISTWSERMTNKTYENGLNYCGVNDPEMQALIDAALDVSTYNEESMTALHNYIKDNACYYALFSPYIYTVTTTDVTDIYMAHDTRLVPGSCTFTWND